MDTYRPGVQRSYKIILAPLHKPIIIFTSPHVFLINGHTLFPTSDFFNPRFLTTHPDVMYYPYLRPNLISHTPLLTVYSIITSTITSIIAVLVKFPPTKLFLTNTYPFKYCNGVGHHVILVLANQPWHIYD